MEGLNLLPTFQKGGGVLTGSQFLQMGLRKEGGTLFGGGGCSFYIKNKLKSEIFNDKIGFINKNVFLCHN